MPAMALVANEAAIRGTYRTSNVTELGLMNSRSMCTPAVKTAASAAYAQLEAAADNMQLAPPPKRQPMARALGTLNRSISPVTQPRLAIYAAAPPVRRGLHVHANEVLCGSGRFDLCAHEPE
jgi:hypothetical protein